MFKIYELRRYTLEENWGILKTYFQSSEPSTQRVKIWWSYFRWSSISSRRVCKEAKLWDFGN